MTRTTPLRRTILHLRQILFTDAITFIRVSLLRPERDPALRQVIRRELHRHLVARQDADVVHAHLSRDEGMDHMPVLQLHPEGRVRQVFHNLSLHLDDIFLGHSSLQRTPGSPPLKLALRSRLSYWWVMTQACTCDLKS